MSTYDDVNAALAALNAAWAAYPKPIVTPPPPQWPSAATTGCGSTVLTPSPMTNVSVPGTYTGLAFSGTVVVNASNVTFRNCKFTSTPAAPFGIQVPGGHTGILFDHCTIIGAGKATTQSAAAYGIYISGNSAVTIQACDISQCGQCVAINDGQVQILGNYMHDLNSGPGSHYECIYYGGAGTATFSMLIQGNNLNNQNGQTASVYLENYFGVLRNVTVDSNLLIGGSYTVYVEGNQAAHDVTNIAVTNNALGTGQFGYINANKGLAPNYQVTVSGNYDWKTNAPVAAVQDSH